MEHKPKRRWLPFSLRTMFALTAFSAWLICQLHWIHQRHELLKERYVGAQRETYPPPHRGVLGPPPRAPGWLWLFREPGYGLIHYPVNLPPAKAARIRQLFPEAEVRTRNVLHEWDEDSRWVEITWDD